MLFFFIGGITPKQVARSISAPCPSCTCSALEESRVDHVLNVFFVPLFTVHRGNATLRCQACGWGEPGRLEEADSPTLDANAMPSAAGMCPSCRQLPPGAAPEQRFKFCTCCGGSLGTGAS